MVSFSELKISVLVSFTKSKLSCDFCQLPTYQSYLQQTNLLEIRLKPNKLIYLISLYDNFTSLKLIIIEYFININKISLYNKVDAN